MVQMVPNSDQSWAVTGRLKMWHVVIANLEAGKELLGEWFLAIRYIEKRTWEKKSNQFFLFVNTPYGPRSLSVDVVNVSLVCMMM